MEVSTLSRIDTEVETNDLHVEGDEGIFMLWYCCYWSRLLTPTKTIGQELTPRSRLSVKTEKLQVETGQDYCNCWDPYDTSKIIGKDSRHCQELTAGLRPMIYMPRQVTYMSRWAILFLLAKTDEVQQKEQGRDSWPRPIICLLRPVRLLWHKGFQGLKFWRLLAENINILRNTRER